MKNKVIGKCPICNNDLYVKTLKCKSCNSEVSGEFYLSPFDKLSKEQQDFALVFIRCQGNIKNIEKIMGISYPTVKKNIEDLCSSLGLTLEKENISRDEVKKRLKNGEISFEEAEELLGGEL